MDELKHCNTKKSYHIGWNLKGRFEHDQKKINKGDWTANFLDALFQFPNALVHDDLVDALAYIDQLAKVSYFYDYEEDDFEILDPVAGY